MPAAPSPFDRLWQEYRGTGRIGQNPQQVLRLLTPIARKVRRAIKRRPPLDDLLSAGTLGLLEALERFDPARGVRFGTFAGWRILGAMLDDQRRATWDRDAHRLKVQRLCGANEELHQRLGRPPSDTELAAALGIPLAEVAAVRRLASSPRPLSLDAARQADRSSPDRGGPADPRRDPLRTLLAAEARSVLLTALKTLPDRPRYTLLLYYFEGLTQAQIGQVLGVTESGVSRIRAEALRRLVQRLGPHGPELLDALGH